MSEAKPVNIDSEGFDILKGAILTLLNQYPALNGREITFSGLTPDGGISMEPESGALVYSETKNIMGEVIQQCQFPFFVVYRTGATSEFLKLNVNEFLDTLGSWLSREPVTVGDEEVRLVKYPELTGGRKITSVTRFNSYALEANDNKTQDWLLPVTVNYTHKFETW